MTLPLADKLTLYPAVHLALMLMAGIVAADGLAASAWPWFVGLCACTGLFVALVLLRPLPWLQSVLADLCFFLVGGVLCAHAENGLRAPLPEGETEYEAVVVSEPKVKGKIVSCDLRLVSGSMKGQKVKASILRDTVSNRWRNIRAGSRLRAISVMEKPRNFPGSRFNYQRWMESHGYRARTFIYYRNWQQQGGGWKGLSRLQKTRLSALRLRSSLTKEFAKRGLEGDEYAVVVAMSLGDKSLLTQDLRDRYSEAGASHVLAISGMHLGIICGVFGFLGLRRRQNVLLQALIVAGLWSYAVMTGLSPSVVRAVLMLTIYVAASLFYISTVPLNTLSLAALLMLMANPLSLWDVGFQMSFVALLGIQLFFRPFYEFLPARFEHPEGSAHAWRCEQHPRGNAFVRSLWSLFVLSLTAQLAVAPLSAYYFGRVPCYFLLTNFAVYILAAFILFGAIAVVALSAVPALQQFAADIVATSAHWLNSSLSFVAGLPGASISGLSFSLSEMFLVYVIIVSLTVIFLILTRPLRRNKEDRDDVFLTTRWNITPPDKAPHYDPKQEELHL